MPSSACYGHHLDLHSFPTRRSSDLLSTYFLREASERLGKPDLHLSSDALDAFSQYWWPGNVRQLKNEIQRAVAMSAPGGTIEAQHLSPEISAVHLPGTVRRSTVPPANLAAAVEQMERDLIQAARSEEHTSE